MNTTPEIDKIITDVLDTAVTGYIGQMIDIKLCESLQSTLSNLYNREVRIENCRVIDGVMKADVYFEPQFIELNFVVDKAGAVLDNQDVE